MRVLLSLVVTFGLFAGSFALHIVGGATDQGWLFAIAVALIFLAATGFPAIALLIAGRGLSQAQVRSTLLAGGLIGIVLTGSALWAANDRSFAWWHVPAAIALVVAVSGVILALLRVTRPGIGSPKPLSPQV